jgi:Zn finger protein HypA/HybF involved in hydrogenase expression
MDETTSAILIIAGILNLIVIIVFFTMAARVRKIMNILKIWAEADLKIQGYERKIICDHCKNEVSISAFEDGIILCPECKKNTRTIQV